LVVYEATIHLVDGLGIESLQVLCQENEEHGQRVSGVVVTLKGFGGSVGGVVPRWHCSQLGTVE